MADHPVVAIALPVYNGAEHLEEALLSFQKQTHPHFKMVICDNASTDGTQEIAERFARSDSRFVYRRQTEFLNARDNFIRSHRLSDRDCKYFLWACDDNIWHPDFLEMTIAYMEANPTCSLCGYYLHHFGGREDRKFAIPMPDSYKRSRLLHFMLERMSIASIYGLMRRTAIDSIDLDLELKTVKDYPDRYYLIQLRSFGHFHVIEQDLLGFRAGGISSTGDDSWVSAVIDLNFGEEELKLLFSLPRITLVEKVGLALKYAYVALRHNIRDVAYRWWLAPAYLAASVMGALRPSAWGVTGRGLQRRDG